MTELTLRTLTESDLPDVAAIYAHAALHTDATLDHRPRTMSELQDWLAAHHGCYPAVAAVRDSSLAGYATLSPFASRTGYLASAELSIYVAPDQQGGGIGGALCGEMTRRAELAGMSTVVAFISSDNHPSRRMVQRHGYQQEGALRRIGYKLGHLVDLEIFQCTFPANCARFDGTPLDDLIGA